MNSRPDATFEDEKNLILRRACIQRRVDLTARAYLVEVCARAISAR